MRDREYELAIMRANAREGSRVAQLLVANEQRAIEDQDAMLPDLDQPTDREDDE